MHTNVNTAGTFNAHGMVCYLHFWGDADLFDVHKSNQIVHQVRTESVLDETVYFGWIIDAQLSLCEETWDFSFSSEPWAGTEVIIWC